MELGEKKTTGLDGAQSFILLAVYLPRVTGKVYLCCQLAPQRRRPQLLARCFCFTRAESSLKREVFFTPTRARPPPLGGLLLKGLRLALPPIFAPPLLSNWASRVSKLLPFSACRLCPAIDFSACVAPLPLHFGAALQSQARALVATTTLGSGDHALQVHADSNKAGLLQPLDWRANIAANVKLDYDTCGCGKARLSAVCTVPVAEGAQLVAGLSPPDTTTYLLQFDGSHNRPHGVGGAGIILFRTLSGRCSTCFWSAIPILPVYNQSLYSMEILCHNIYSAGHTLNKRRCRESIFHEQTRRVRSKRGGF